MVNDNNSVDNIIGIISDYNSAHMAKMNVVLGKKSPQNSHIVIVMLCSLFVNIYHFCKAGSNSFKNTRNLCESTAEPDET